MNSDPIHIAANAPVSSRREPELNEIGRPDLNSNAERACELFEGGLGI